MFTQSYLFCTVVNEAFWLVKASLDWSVSAGIEPGMHAKPLPLHELSQNCVHAFFMGLYCLVVSGCSFWGKKTLILLLGVIYHNQVNLLNRFFTLLTGSEFNYDLWKLNLSSYIKYFSSFIFLLKNSTINHNYLANLLCTWSIFFLVNMSHILSIFFLFL